MSSKKKTKGKNNRNTRKQTVIHYPRNLTILCIIAVLFGMIVYHSLNVYSQESILEYPGEQSVAGYTVADNNYHIEDADTHYIDYTFDDRSIRVLWLNLSAEAAVDTNFQVQSFYNDEKVEEITIGVPAGQYAEKTYLNHKPVNRLRISSDQDFSLDSVYIDHLQKTQGGEEGPLQKKVAAFVVVLILVSCWLAKREKTELLINKCKDSFKNLGSYLQHHPKHVLIMALLYVGAVVCGWVLRNLYVMAVHHGSWQCTSKSVIYGAMLGLIGFEIIKYLFLAKKRTFEVLFLRCGVILCLGLTLLLPLRLNVSWDDQIHYLNAAGASHLQNNTLALSEEDFTMTCFSGQLKIYSDSNVSGIKNIFNDPAARVTKTEQEEVSIKYNTLVYLPVILVFFITRGLGIPLSAMIVLGRLASALFYLVIIYLGMRHLKSGKMIMAAVALMPGAVFIVCNYNYDYWLISLIAYSIAYLIGEYQHPEKILTLKDIILIFGTFLIGMIVKPVYIPLLGLAAFLPACKFKNAKWRRIYRCFFGGIVILAVIGFSVLIFGGGLGRGDIRGGEDVNAVGQIQYIMANPKKYTEVLLFFLRYQYLNLTMFKTFIVQTAYYLSIPTLGMPCIIWLVAVTILDRRKEDVKSVGCPVKITILPLAFITACCVATAMYVMFSAVGSASIEGCQGRYLWPIVTPLFLTLGQIRFLTIPRSDKVDRYIQGASMVISIALASCMITEFL